MPLSESVTAGTSGHPGFHNTLHAAYNNVEAVPKTVWVDGTNGSDSNSGLSPLLPKQTIDAALTVMNEGGWTCYIAPGRYQTSTGWTYNEIGAAFVASPNGSRNEDETFEGHGVYFEATGSGSFTLFRYNTTTSIKHLSPTFVGINFVNNSTGTVTLLHLHNANQWKLDSVSFKDGDVGLHTTRETGGDNAWGLLLHCSFQGQRIGWDNESGYGHRDYGSLYTNCSEFSIDFGRTDGTYPFGSDSNKFFGTFFDGGDVPDQGRIILRNGSSSNEFYGVKFERLGGDDNDTRTTQYMLHIDSSDNNIFGCTFSSGTNNQDAMIYLDANSANNTIVGPSFVNMSPVGKRVLRHASAGAALVLSVESPEWDAANYTVTNALTDRSFNANATSIDELADVLGTLIADLDAMGIIH